jgi:predicted nucleic acid-binding protein
MSADFLDSNIFIYLFDETDERRREIARRLVHKGIESGDACISFQVVQETLAVLTGKLKRRATLAEAHHFLAVVLAPLWRVMPAQRSTHEAWSCGSAMHSASTRH